MGFWVVKESRAGYVIHDSRGRPLETPQGHPICVPRAPLANLIAEYVNLYGTDDFDGMSPYGLESSYRDFELDEQRDAIRNTLVETLKGDSLLSRNPPEIRRILEAAFGFDADQKRLLSICRNMKGRPLAVLITFGATYGSISLAIHMFVDRRGVPDRLIKEACSVYNHVTQFNTIKLMESALQGAYVDGYQNLSPEPDDALISMCRRCCLHGSPLESDCPAKRPFNWALRYAELSSDNRPAATVELSAQRALAIARSYAERDVDTKVIRECATYLYSVRDSIVGTRLSPYGLPDEPAWYVTLPWYDGKDGTMLRSSRLVAIAKRDGRGIFDGSAGDEG